MGSTSSVEQEGALQSKRGWVNGAGKAKGDEIFLTPDKAFFCQIITLMTLITLITLLIIAITLMTLITYQAVGGAEGYVAATPSGLGLSSKMPILIRVLGVDQQGIEAKSTQKKC